MKNRKPFQTLACAAALLLIVSGCSKKSGPPAETPAGQTAQTAQNPPPPPPDQPLPPQSAQSAAAPANNSAAPMGNQPPAGAVIPAGTRVRVRLDQDLGSKISQTGETFGATVATDVVSNGQVIVRRGARASGTVIDARALGRFKGHAVLALRLETIRADGHIYAVRTSTIDRVERGKGKRTAGFVGGGAGLGAILGGLTGGGRGALIGGVVGAGAGTAGSAFSDNREIFLPAETLLTFRLERPVPVSE